MRFFDRFERAVTGWWDYGQMRRSAFRLTRRRLSKLRRRPPVNICEALARKRDEQRVIRWPNSSARCSSR